MHASVWWLAVLALMAWSLGAGYFPDAAPGVTPVAAYTLGVLSAALLCLSILAHECGHAFEARRRALGVESIDLWLLGGVARLQAEPSEPRDELRCALAGPAVSAVLTAVCAAGAVLTGGGGTPALHALITYQLLVNGSLLGFNLLPAFPLDGGRVLRAALWQRGLSFHRATELSAQAGRALGALLALFGVVEVVLGTAAGVWVAVIGGFLVVTAGAEIAHARLGVASARLAAVTMMTTPAVTIPAGLSVQQAADNFFLAYRYTAFPVIDADTELLGLVTIAGAEAVPHGKRNSTAVGDIVEHDRELVVASDFDVADLLDRPAFARVGRAVVVDRAGAPIGLISITDVQRSIRALRLSGDGAAPRHHRFVRPDRWRRP